MIGGPPGTTLTSVSVSSSNTVTAMLPRTIAAIVRVISACVKPNTLAISESTLTSSWTCTASPDSCGLTNIASCAISATRSSAAAVIASTLLPVTAKLSPCPAPRIFRLLPDRTLTCTPGTVSSRSPMLAMICACVRSRAAQSDGRTMMNALVPPLMPMMLRTAVTSPLSR
ncbi:hypothetical protein ACSSV4_004482 [Roseovarius sp. MBR-154]